MPMTFKDMRKYDFFINNYQLFSYIYKGIVIFVFYVSFTVEYSFSYKEYCVINV